MSTKTDCYKSLIKNKTLFNYVTLLQNNERCAFLRDLHTSRTRWNLNFF